MNFKIGIVDSDTLFVSRFKEALEEQYGNEMIVLTFEKISDATIAAKKYGLSILLTGKQSGKDKYFNTYDFPEEIAIIYLCEYRAEEDDCPEKHIVCKYRNIDQWHEIILNTVLKSKKTRIQNYKNKVEKNNACRICLFTSAAGGTGTTTAAAAYAMCCSRKGYKTCYLNFETINSTNRFFETKGNIHDFEDIISALRSEIYHKETLIQTAFVEDPLNGVSCIPACRVQSDMFTLTGEDIVKICEMIRDSENFEYIILDMNFEVSENIVLPFINSNMVILVTDGSEIGNYKTDCFISLLPIMLNSRETDISSKTRILYNRFDRNKGMALKTKNYVSIGGLPLINAISEKIIAEKVSFLSPMDRLVREVEKSLN